MTNTTAEANNWVQLTNTGASDTTAPTVVVTRSGTGTVGASGETIVFTLSEASTDFVVGDIDVSAGSLSDFKMVAGSNGTVYTATYTPPAGSNSSATIAQTWVNGVPCFRDGKVIGMDAAELKAKARELAAAAMVRAGLHHADVATTTTLYDGGN